MDTPDATDASGSVSPPLCSSPPPGPEPGPSPPSRPGVLAAALDRLRAAVAHPASTPSGSLIVPHGLDAGLYTPPAGLTLRATRSDPHVRRNLASTSSTPRSTHSPRGQRAAPFGVSSPPRHTTDLPMPISIPGSPPPPKRKGFLAHRLRPDPRGASDTERDPMEGTAQFRRYLAYHGSDDSAAGPEAEGQMLAPTGVGGGVLRPQTNGGSRSYGTLPEGLPTTRPRPHSDLSISHRRHGWWYNLIRPPSSTVERWLDSWAQRWSILIVVPSCIVWVWCAVPFPKSSPTDPNGPWCSGPTPPPWCSTPEPVPLPGDPTLAPASVSLGTIAFIRLWLAEVKASWWASAPVTQPVPPVDANFWFFLVVYYGLYSAVGLLWITQLFTLYRLNWWPKALGAKVSYTFFWLASLAAGYGLHELDLYRRRKEKPDESASDHWDWEEDDVQWQRKTMWVGLAFATMAMPALVCLVGLRRSGRARYSMMITDLQRTFFERHTRRIPASYTRFLWFMFSIGLALVALVLGQAYASVFLSTLPHSGIEGTAYVVLWQGTVTLLTQVSSWVMNQKVRSRALFFVFRYYFFMTYFIFYRNLFARLPSFNQFALLQLLSSFWICIWYPASMSAAAHRIASFFDPQPKSWEEYVENIGLAFYQRNLAQNATMVAFLGWVSILHFGPNQALYPFFAFANDDNVQYGYAMTMYGSSAIWASELASAFLARALCKTIFHVDVTNLGLGDLRAYPELVPTCLWTSVHVLMDMLLFLLKLNFR